MNLITSVRVADPLRQHTTWYGYNHNGQIDTVWTELGPAYSGLGVKAPTYPQPLSKPATADIAYSYTKTGQVEVMDYPAAQMFVSYAYNQRKWLDSMVAYHMTPPPNPPMMAPLFKQVLSYDPAGQITQQRYQHTNAPEQVQYYSYDSLQRLTNWGNGGGDTAQYDYDKVGNRLFNWTNTYLDTLSYYGAGPNQVSQRFHDDYMGNQTFTDYNYNADGAVTGMTTSYLPPLLQPIYDTLHYSWRGLTRGYQHQVGTNGELRDWRYRYSAGGEREQKRLYLGRDDNHNALNNRAWVYYLLGANVNVADCIA